MAYLALLDRFWQLKTCKRVATAYSLLTFDSSVNHM